MTLDEQVTVAGGGLGKINPEHALGNASAEKNLSRDVEDLLELTLARFVNEREARDVAGDAGTTTHDHVRMRCVAFRPGSVVIEFHVS